MIARCPACNGSVLRLDGEIKCLNCGRPVRTLNVLADQIDADWVAVVRLDEDDVWGDGRTLDEATAYEYVKGLMGGSYMARGMRLSVKRIEIFNTRSEGDKQ